MRVRAACVSEKQTERVALQHTSGANLYVKAMPLYSSLQFKSSIPTNKTSGHDWVVVKLLLSASKI